MAGYHNFSKSNNAIQAEKEAQKNKKALYECEFLVWSGSRNHPKATSYTEIGEIVGNWFFSSFGKKSINANGFKVLRKVD